eukprot:12421236-Alexandrium_andersonii.AAC.1
MRLGLTGGCCRSLMSPRALPRRGFLAAASGRLLRRMATWRRWPGVPWRPRRRRRARAPGASVARG